MRTKELVNAHGTFTDRSSRGFRLGLEFLLLDGLNGRWHRPALAVYALLVLTHFLEHVIQLAQVHLLRMAPREAGGLLGEAFPGLLTNELLHTAYNSLQLAGLILLLPGFRRHRRARTFWVAAIVVQSWHWLEHAFLQVQYATGYYFFGALKQMSVLERLFPRLELHFAYNLLVFVPTAIALVLYLASSRRRRTGTVSVEPERNALGG